MNPYQQPRQQVVDAAYHCRVKWFVGIVMFGFVTCALTLLVKPFDQSWHDFLFPTPSVAVHVPPRAEIQSHIDSKVKEIVKP